MTSRLGPWSPVSTIAAAVRGGRATAVEIVDAAIERAIRVQSELNCFAEIDVSGARAAAAAIDRRRTAGEALGPLAGVPVAIKDCTPVAGLGNRFGSHAFADNVASKDAVIVQRFRHADAVILGKTTLPEFAFSSFCDSPLTGVTRNPWNPERTPGGSSGGSAVAVATGCVAIAQGTDMGGSVRIPASCTGLVGIKPAAGRIPLDDQPSFVDDIQHHGLLTRTVADLAASLPLICGPSFTDPTTYIPELPALDTTAGVSGLRIAVSHDLGFFLIEPEIKDRLDRAAKALEAAGAIVRRPSLDWDRSIADGWVRHWHVYLASFFGDGLDRIGPLADPRLVEAVGKGRTHDAVSIKRLDLLRHRQWEVLADLFRDYDVLLSPTMARPPAGVDENDASYHAISSDGKKRGLDMTSVFNWTPWCPALTVPAGLSSDGLPIGLHVAAHPQREDVILRVAAAIEQSFPHQWPPGWRP
jgi:Asp-tRNA(Asn)/Glu-tRNA(Gln) amidotransferase A subunit family amidase